MTKLGALFGCPATTRTFSQEDFDGNGKAMAGKPCNWGVGDSGHTNFAWFAAGAGDGHRQRVR